MEIHENPIRSKEYLEPKKHSIANMPYKPSFPTY
jgi:hypothetical protein